MKNRSRYKNLRAYVEDSGQTQRRIAKRLRIGESTLSQYINRTRIPQPEIALRIAKVCNVPLESLLAAKVAA